MVESDNLVWMDLEMTGLDPKENKIIEVATVITDRNLQIIAESEVFAIHRSEDELARMDEWNIKTHSSSGLIERVRKSSITDSICEEKILDFIKQYVPERTSPLCGNSIWQDRRFLIEYMPTLEHYLHYRNIDVSTIKELVRLWKPELKYIKKERHEALSDIKESIEELKFYRNRILTI